MIPRRLDRLPLRLLDGDLRLFEATTFRSRLLGLARLEGLRPGHALVLHRCRMVHTFGMRFALDLVFLDGGGRPVRIVRDVGPRRFVACPGASAVVETLAGESECFARALP